MRPAAQIPESRSHIFVIHRPGDVTTRTVSINAVRSHCDLPRRPARLEHCRRGLRGTVPPSASTSAAYWLPPLPPGSAGGPTLPRAPRSAPPTRQRCPRNPGQPTVQHEGDADALVSRAVAVLPDDRDQIVGDSRRMGTAAARSLGEMPEAPRQVAKPASASASATVSDGEGPRRRPYRLRGSRKETLAASIYAGPAGEDRVQASHQSRGRVRLGAVPEIARWK